MFLTVLSLIITIINYSKLQRNLTTYYMKHILKNYSYDF